MRSVRRSGLVVIAVNVVAIVVVLGLVMIAVRMDIGFTTFTDDPAEGERRWYAGVLSDIGVAGWFVAAVGAIVAASFHRSDGRALSFFSAMAIVSIWLGLDDLFLLHEDVLPRRVGVPEAVSLLIYPVVVAGIVLAFLGVVRRHDGWILIVASFFLVGSLVTNTVGVGLLASSSAEAAAKFLGIVNWSMFLVLACTCRRRSTGGRRVVDLAGIPRKPPQSRR